MKRKRNKAIDFLGVLAIIGFLAIAIAAGVGYRSPAPAGIDDTDAANYLDYLVNRYQTLATGILAFLAGAFVWLSAWQTNRQAERHRRIRERLDTRRDVGAVTTAFAMLQNHCSPDQPVDLPDTDVRATCSSLTAAATTLGARFAAVSSGVVTDAYAATQDLRRLRQLEANETAPTSMVTQEIATRRTSLIGAESRMAAMVLVADNLINRLADMDDPMQLPYANREHVVRELERMGLPIDQLFYVEHMFTREPNREHKKTDT